MAIVEVPLSPQPQTFQIQLGQVTYNLTLAWNDDTAGQCWVLDIADVNGSAIVSGIPLVTGSDLLSQYAYIGFSGALVVLTDGDATAVPTFKNLGINSHLYFVTPDA